MSVIDEAAALEREDWLYRHTPRWELIDMGILCERCDCRASCRETRAGEMLCDKCAGR